MKEDDDFKYIVFEKGEDQGFEKIVKIIKILLAIMLAIIIVMNNNAILRLVK